MATIGITDEPMVQEIADRKEIVYPEYFDLLTLNSTLIELIRMLRSDSVKVGIVSTARRKNIINILNYFGISSYFDSILGGDEMKIPKPHPDSYVETMRKYNCDPRETLIFEDSYVGLTAAKRSGANYIKISDEFFKN